MMTFLRRACTQSTATRRSSRAVQGERAYLDHLRDVLRVVVKVGQGAGQVDVDGVGRQRLPDRGEVLDEGEELVEQRGIAHLVEMYAQNAPGSSGARPFAIRLGEGVHPALPGFTRRFSVSRLMAARGQETCRYVMGDYSLAVSNLRCLLFTVDRVRIFVRMCEALLGAAVAYG
ncbi:hypothetical protein [Streptomyces mirabilis]|uniref:hypothetical protein n=1 Tax=Streptomyces mirabilis TaxID=68239 RepID=UPI0033E5F2B7